MRVDQHRKIIELYKKYGYKVVEVPVFTDNVEESIKQRIAKIKSELEI
jgi:hypothetical protein